MRGPGFATARRWCSGFRLEMTMDEDDVPDDPVSGIQPGSSGTSRPLTRT
jgi:hypothetical protein